MADPSKQQRATGRVIVHPRGFGFLEVERGLSAFITPPDLNLFLADDVASAVLRRGEDGRWTAAQLELVERRRTRLFGEVVERRGALYLRTDPEVANTDWPLEAGQPVAVGAAAVATLEGPRLRLLKVFPAAADLSLERVIARHGLEPAFPAEALEEARRLQAAVAPELAGRQDLRAIPTVTVDAPSTRDIDDAISVLPADEEGALRVLVSIADVAGAIPAGGALDRAARGRGTSVYLAGRVLPMIPEELSTDALSLLPGRDRACLTVELRLGPEAEVRAIDLYPSLIRSAARISYTELAAYLDEHVTSPALETVRPMLPWLRTAAARLGLHRARRGGVEHSREETRIVFDAESGAPTALESARPTSAHRLIERFMVAANEAVAAWLHDRGVPTLYRVHDEPAPAAVAEVSLAARQFGLETGFGPRLTPLSLAAFDEQITGAPCEPALRSILLRSLGRARYTAAPGPHFGIASPLYLHFTSPIRRYADLAVHRAIRDYLAGRREFAGEATALEALGGHLNERARAASRAELDRSRVLIAALMEGRVGETFAAHVTRVRPFGLMVQLDGTEVEGAVPGDALPGGPYRPDAGETALVGPERSFLLGAPLQVRLVATDPRLGRLELALA